MLIKLIYHIIFKCIAISLNHCDSYGGLYIEMAMLKLVGVTEVVGPIGPYDDFSQCYN